MDFEALLRWAEQHHGLVRTDELRASELTRTMRAVREGTQFERLSPRVLRRTGTPRTPHQEALAAVLDAGEGAALAGGASGWLWQAPGFQLTTPVELTRERGRSKTRRDLLGVVHERRWLPEHHVTIVAGIPTLTLPVLLYQLAGRLSPPRFERIFEGAGRRPPRRQVSVGGHEWIGRVDYLDAEFALIFEIQSQTYHSAFLDKAADAARVEALLGAGFAGVLQVPEEAVWYRPHDVLRAADLASAAIAMIGSGADPTAFVVSIRALGMQFEMTKRRDGRGRMTG